MRTFRTACIVAATCASLGAGYAWAATPDIGVQQDPEVSYAPWRAGLAIVTARSAESVRPASRKDGSSVTATVAPKPALPHHGSNAKATVAPDAGV